SRRGRHRPGNTLRHRRRVSRADALRHDARAGDRLAHPGGRAARNARRVRAGRPRPVPPRGGRGRWCRMLGLRRRPCAGQPAHSGSQAGARGLEVAHPRAHTVPRAESCPTQRPKWRYTAQALRPISKDDRMAVMPTDPAHELRGERKYYRGVPAVRDLDLSIPRGTTYGVLGPNGAGKTTTIRMALRILEPDSGAIDLLGRPLSQSGLDRVGYLPEERGIYRRMKVRDLLAFLAELKGMRRRDARPEIDRWLERMELGAWADKKVQDLSKGMQQKIQFIGAVLHDPEVIVLDEPFSGLDPINQQVLREIVVELKRANRTIIF